MAKKKASPRKATSKPTPRKASPKRRATKRTPAAPKPRRRAGAPKRTEPVVTPDMLREMSKLYGRGMSVRAIADELGLHVSTVCYHRDKTFLPLLAENMRPNLAELYAVNREVRAEAWAGWERSQQDEVRITERETEDGFERTITRVGQAGNAGFLGVILQTLDWESKVAGYYAAGKLKIEHEGELRVAGQSRDELNEQMMRRVVAMVIEDAKRKELTA